MHYSAAAVELVQLYSQQHQTTTTTHCYSNGGDDPHRRGVTPLLRAIGCVRRAPRVSMGVRYTCRLDCHPRCTIKLSLAHTSLPRTASRSVHSFLHGSRSSTTQRNKHTHTHPFNGPLSGTTRVSRYQKGKTNLDFTEARDSEWQWHQLGHMQVCTSLRTDNHASTPSLSSLQAGCPSCCPTNSVKALKA